MLEELSWAAVSKPLLAWAVGLPESGGMDGAPQRQPVACRSMRHLMAQLGDVLDRPTKLRLGLATVVSAGQILAG